VQVHRVEHKRLRHPYVRQLPLGPFAGSSIARVSISRLDAVRMPTPYRDGLSRWTDNHVCGFADLGKLHRWFTTRDWNLLRPRGYVLRSYLVPPPYVKFGEEQVMFDYTRRVR
jgi:hypothetical protein